MQPGLRDPAVYDSSIKGEQSHRQAVAVSRQGDDRWSTYRMVLRGYGSCHTATKTQS